MRVNKPFCSWAKGIWISQATPKYAFIAWLASLDRLSTLDRVAKWSRGLDETCVLCKSAKETKDHLFFEYAYSAQIWEFIDKGIMGSSYTNRWEEIMVIVCDTSKEKKNLCLIRYSLQAVLYEVWRVRNKVRHGDKLLPLPVIKRMLDKGIRNKISVMRKKGLKGMEDVMQLWFSYRM